MADKKYRLKFGMSDGTEKSVEFTAPQGDKGDPGITPVVAVSDITGGHRVTITTGSDVQSFDVLDGKNAEGGGTADAVAWENVTGKPFNESLTGTAIADGDTLSWDGNKDAMPIMTGNAYTKFCYVSDNVPTMEQISAGHALVLKTYAGTEVNINVTPSESDGYISFADVDGQYLYIIKKPCTIGINTFERAGIYFYAQGNTTAHICRLTINGYTFTEMGSIKDAYIPQAIARKSDIPQGGGVQVQSDYTQHDATAPDYIKNRPFWPEWSPVLVNIWTDNSYANQSGYFYEETDRELADSIFSPVEGKHYTFGAGSTLCSGIAKRGNFILDDKEYPGIGIVDEQDENSLVIYTEGYGFPQFMFKMPHFDHVPGTRTFFFVIEGDNTYNKLSVPDDAIAMPGNPDGVYVVQDLTEQYKKFQAGSEKAMDMFAALTSDFEIVAEMDGTELTLTKNEVQYVENVEMMGYTGNAYMYGGQAPLAIMFYVPAFDMYMLALLDLNALGMAPITAKSIKINYPGIFAPTIAAKKMPEECMPESVEGIVVRSSTAGSEKLFKITVDDSGVVSATEVT